MIDVELFGLAGTRDAPSAAELRRLCNAAAASRSVAEGHVAVEFVDAARIAELNARHRGRTGPTDVLSFPIDGIDGIDGIGRTARPAGADGGQAGTGIPRELGDVVVCPEHTVDVREAVVHGMLHLLGMDHERDGGEMLALQDRLLAGGG